MAIGGRGQWIVTWRHGSHGSGWRSSAGVGMQSGCGRWKVTTFSKGPAQTSVSCVGPIRPQRDVSKTDTNKCVGPLRRQRQSVEVLKRAVDYDQCGMRLHRVRAREHWPAQRWGRQLDSMSYGGCVYDQIRNQWITAAMDDNRLSTTTWIERGYYSQVLYEAMWRKWDPQTYN